MSEARKIISEAFNEIDGAIHEASDSRRKELSLNITEALAMMMKEMDEKGWHKSLNLSGVIMSLNRMSLMVAGIEDDEYSVRGMFPLKEDVIHSVVEDLEKRAFQYERHSKSDPSIRQAVLALTDGKCTYCDVELIDGGQASNSFVVEHVVPASKGGPDNLVNYVPACQSCNISKRDGHVLDFIKRRQGGNVTTLPTLPKREAAE